MRNRLKAERQSHRWTQHEVASKLGVTVRTYQKYESADLTPSLDVANKLEDLFGIPQRELLVRDCTPDPDKTELKILQIETLPGRLFKNIKSV